MKCGSERVLAEPSITAMISTQFRHVVRGMGQLMDFQKCRYKDVTWCVEGSRRRGWLQ